MLQTQSNIVNDLCRLDIKKYSFSERTWNKLSTDCINASSVNMFKNKIDKGSVTTIWVFCLGGQSCSILLHHCRKHFTGHFSADTVVY